MKQRAVIAVLNIENRLQCFENLDENIAELIITEELHKAFEEAGDANKKELFKKLSLLLHPDRLNLETSLGKSLNAINATHLPQKVLNRFNVSAPTVNDFVSNPLQSTITALYYVGNKLQDIYNTHTRYVQPFSAIITALTVLLGVTGIIVTGVVFLLVFLIIIPQFLIQKIMTLFCGSKIGDQIFEMSKEMHAEGSKILDPEISDEAIQASLQDPLVQAALKDQSFGTVRGTYRLKAIAKALWETISEPLPESIPAAILSCVLIRPLTLLIAPFYLVLETGFEALRFIHGIALLTTMAVFTGIVLTELFLANIPLYLYDGACYLVNCWTSSSTSEYSSLINAKPSEPVTEQTFAEMDDSTEYRPLFRHRPTADTGVITIDNLVLVDGNEEEKPFSIF